MHLLIATFCCSLWWQILQCYNEISLLDSWARKPAHETLLHGFVEFNRSPLFSRFYARRFLVLELLDHLCERINKKNGVRLLNTWWKTYSNGHYRCFSRTSSTIKRPLRSHSFLLFCAYLRYSSLETPNTPQFLSFLARGIM